MNYQTEIVKKPFISGALEADSDSLLDALGFLKKLLMNMQTSMVEKKANLKKHYEEVC